MNIRFEPGRVTRPDTLQGMKVPYGPARRSVAKWRWRFILLTTVSPLLLLAYQIVQPMIQGNSPGVIAFDRVTVVCETPAVIDKVLVKPGDRVLPGQQLVSLAQPEEDERLARLEEELAGLEHLQFLQRQDGARPEAGVTEELSIARETERRRRKNLGAVQELFDKGAATRAELDEAFSLHQQARLAVAQARPRPGPAVVTPAESRVNAGRIRTVAAEIARIRARQQARLTTAPTEGFVLEVPVKEGQSIPMGASLVVLGRAGQPHIEGFFDPKYATTLRAGTELQVKLPDGKRLRAEVERTPEMAKEKPTELSPPYDAQRVAILARLRISDRLPDGHAIDGLPVSIIMPLWPHPES